MSFLLHIAFFSDVRELESWMDTINMVAATLSAPPLAPAVGSQTKKFQRPLLPVSHTKLNLRDQLIEQEKRISKMEAERENHLSKPPERSASKAVIAEYSEKEAYLQYEVCAKRVRQLMYDMILIKLLSLILSKQLRRYKTYSTLLKIKLQQQLGVQAMDIVAKGALLTTKSSKPLTSLAIGEEMLDDSPGQDEFEENGSFQPKLKAEEPVFKPIKHRSANELRSKNSSSNMMFNR